VSSQAVGQRYTLAGFFQSLAQSLMKPPHNGNRLNSTQYRTKWPRLMANASSPRAVSESRAPRESSARAAAIRDKERPLALLLDLSGNENAAMEWASARLPETAVRILNKVDLKWASKRKALSFVRSLGPDVFCVYASDWKLQSGRGALMLFAILAGARHVVIGDARLRGTCRSRLGVLLLEAPRFALELLAGYGLLVPLSWLLTEAQGLSLSVRAPVQASRISKRSPHPEQELCLSALYIRATITSAAERWNVHARRGVCQRRLRLDTASSSWSAEYKATAKP
jgi:hypothetical protein